MGARFSVEDFLSGTEPEVKEKKVGKFSVEDFLPKDVPLYKAHETESKVSFKDMTPSERVEKFGTIEEWTPVDEFKDRAFRFSNVIGHAVLGDIPGLRKMLPESIKGATPVLPREKLVAPLATLGRDIAIYGGAGKLAKPLTKLHKYGKAGRAAQKTISEGIKGGLVGAVSAESEDPLKIAKKAGIYGSIGAGTVPAVGAISWAGSKVVNALGKSNRLSAIGEWLGMSARQNKANDLVRKRFGDINSRLIDSEKYLDDLGKQITVDENRALAHIVESGIYRDQTVKSVAVKAGGEFKGGTSHTDAMSKLSKKVQDGIASGKIQAEEGYMVGKKADAFGKKDQFMNKKDIRRKLGREDDIDAADLMGRNLGDIYGVDSKVQNISTNIRKYLDDAHSELMRDYGKDVGFVKDYVPHMWDIPKNKEKEVINWFVTRNPHLKQRRIETIEEGVKKFGLKPKYDKITDILRVYDQIRITSASNLKFAQGLKEIEESGIKLIQRADKAPTDWPIIDHPALRRAMGRLVGKGDEKKLIISKEPVRVHPSIHADVKAVLDMYQPGKAAKIIDTAGIMVKQSVLNLSLFHAGALTETGIAAGIGKEVMKAWNPVTIIKAFKSGNHKAFLQNTAMAKDAVKDGVNLGSIADVEGGRSLVDVLKRAEKALKDDVVGLGIKVAVRKPLEFNNKFLWDYLHTTFKMQAHAKLKGDMIKAFPNKSPEVIGKEIGAFVNDTFGGQAWDIMAKSNEWRQFSRFALLSPDWVLSTMKQAVSPFGVGAQSKAGMEIRKELGKDFWRKALIYFGGSMNILNYAYSKAHTGKGRYMWENPPGKETYLFTGYNPDGSERHLRWGKQFRELAEAIKNPFEVAGRKINPLIRITKHQTWPSEIWQKDIKQNPFWSAAGIEARGKQLLKDVTPYSITQQQRIGEFNPVGLAMPISRGMTPYNAREYFKQSIKRDDKDLFLRTWEASVNNEIDAEKSFKQAKSAVRSELDFEATLKSNKIFSKYRKLGVHEGQIYMQRLEFEGELTPLIKKKLLKIMKTKMKASKQKQQFEELMEKFRGE